MSGEKSLINISIFIVNVNYEGRGLREKGVGKERYNPNKKIDHFSEFRLKDFVDSEIAGTEVT